MIVGRSIRRNWNTELTSFYLCWLKNITTIWWFWLFLVSLIFVCIFQLFIFIMMAAFKATCFAVSCWQTMLLSHTFLLIMSLGRGTSPRTITKKSMFNIQSDLLFRLYSSTILLPKPHYLWISILSAIEIWAILDNVLGGVYFGNLQILCILSSFPVKLRQRTPEWLEHWVKFN